MAALLAAAAVACAAQGGRVGEDQLAQTAFEGDEKLRVVATTSVVGDVVAQVGGGAIDLTVLMGPGQDPHSFEPTAGDLSTVGAAHVVFINGLGLEGGLQKTIETAAGGTPLVAVSAGVETLVTAEGEGDPHTWMDPHNVMVWAENIALALGRLDPAKASAYAGSAAAYVEELRALDAYIVEQTGRIPPAERKLVTNHAALGYFARRYGFEVVGTVYSGTGQLAEPGAGDLAALVDAIRAEGARAIFVETTVSEELAAVVADEVGYEVGVYRLYTGSLGEPGSGADSYIGMMRANTDAIVAGLLGG